MDRLTSVHPDRPSGSRHRFTSRLALFATLLALVPTLGGRAAEQLQSDGSASPASGPAAVIAQGLAPLTGSDIAWRVTTVTADPADGVGELTAVLGFVLADSGTVLLGESDSGKRSRLAPGEASFLREGQALAVAALGDDPAVFYEFALVPSSEPADAPGVEVVHAGQPFPGPAGDHDLDLIRAALAQSESTTLPEGSGPTLILATDGTLEAAPDDGAAPTTLSAGEAAEFGGAVTVRATSGDATFAAAVLGPQVAPPDLLVPAPATSAAAVDTADQDRDTVSDADEALIGSDSANPGSDGDGTIDGRDTNPIDPAVS